MAYMVSLHQCTLDPAPSLFQRYQNLQLLLSSQCMTAAGPRIFDQKAVTDDIYSCIGNTTCFGGGQASLPGLRRSSDARDGHSCTVFPTHLRPATILGSS